MASCVLAWARQKRPHVPFWMTARLACAGLRHQVRRDIARHWSDWPLRNDHTARSCSRRPTSLRRSASGAPRSTRICPSISATSEQCIRPPGNAERRMRQGPDVLRRQLRMHRLLLDGCMSHVCMFAHGVLRVVCCMVRFTDMCVLCCRLSMFGGIPRGVGR